MALIDPTITNLIIFVLAIYVGYHVVWTVTPALHTPLMAVTNAISAIVIVGAMLAAALTETTLGRTLGVVAVALAAGNVLGIYPEGTRSPDGKLYRGHTGVARMALAAEATVIPVAICGTRDVSPAGKTVPRVKRVSVEIGKPLDFSRYEGMGDDRFVLRSMTDEIMYEIMALSDQEYSDMYASRAKKLLSERDETTSPVT